MAFARALAITVLFGASSGVALDALGCAHSSCRAIGDLDLVDEPVVEMSLIQKDQQLLAGGVQDEQGLPVESASIAGPTKAADVSALSRGKRRHAPVDPKPHPSTVGKGYLCGLGYDGAWKKAGYDCTYNGGFVGFRAALITTVGSLMCCFLMFYYISRQTGGSLSDMLIKVPESTGMKALVLSVQITQWVVLLAILFLYIGRKQMQDAGFDPATIVCNILFIVGRNWGATARNILYGSIGTFCASFTLWTMNGFMPGGYTEGAEAWIWNAGFVILMGYMGFFLFLNLNGTIKFFALVNFVGYAMIFLDPGSTAHVSTNFELHWDGTAVNALGLYGISSALSLLFMTLPPRTGFAQATAKVRQIRDDCFKLSQALFEIYCGSKATLELSVLKSEVLGLRAGLNDANAFLEEAWYESFFFAFARGGIGNYSIQATQNCIDTLSDILTLHEPLFDIIKSEEFDKDHNEIMAKLKTPLRDTIAHLDALTQKLFDAAEDGDGCENAEIDQHIRSAESVLANASKELQSAVKKVSFETQGEQFFAYTMIETGRKTISHSKVLLTPESILTRLLGYIDAFATWFGDIFTFDVASLKWSCRTMMQMQIGFWLGYYGYCNEEMGPDDPMASCFLNPKNSNLAMYVVIFMSPDTSATFKAALDRVAAVVLATVSGELLYVLLGWCTLWGRLSAAFAMFFVVTPTLFVGFGSGPNAAIGTRLAAISALFLMKPCSGEVLTVINYSADYHGLIDIILAMFIMGLVDCLFGDKRASLDSVDHLLLAIHQLQAAFSETLEGRPLGRFASYVDKIADSRAQLDNAKSKSIVAVNEPQLWNPAWRPMLFHEIHACFVDIGSILSSFANLVENERESLLEPCSGFGAVCFELEKNLHETVDVSTSLLKRIPCDRLIKKVTGDEKIKTLDQLLKDIQDVTAKAKEKAPTSNERSIDMSTKFAVIVVTLKSLNRCMAEHRGQMIFAGQ